MSVYPRPKYGQDGIKTISFKPVFTPDTMIFIPQPDYPIHPIENFRLAAAHKTPVWLPNSALDFQSYFTADFLEGFYVFPWGSEEETVHVDEFGCQWKYVVSAGGSMLDPAGKPVVDDITDWEKLVKFPKLELKISDFMERNYSPEKVLHVDVFQGATERLVALMGGYSEALLAMAEEPEACAGFVNAFADWEIALIDKLFEEYPVNLITYHDDWGTERDTFFSENMMEDLVLEPTRRIVQHVKNKGAAFELHSCGCIGRFLNYMIDIGVDFLQIQPRANDVPKMKREFGDKVGFCVFSEKLMEPALATGDIISAAREIVDTFGMRGGAYTGMFLQSPEPAWDFIFELYAHSREYYDRERSV